MVLVDLYSTQDFTVGQVLCVKIRRKTTKEKDLELSNSMDFLRLWFDLWISFLYFLFSRVFSWGSVVVGAHPDRAVAPRLVRPEAYEPSVLEGEMADVALAHTAEMAPFRRSRAPPTHKAKLKREMKCTPNVKM